jgi:hypothetical protein
VRPDVAGILEVLRSQRFLWSTEDELQRGLAITLALARYGVAREIRLNERDRIDLLVGTVGIEVKTTGPWRDVQRQLERYLLSPLVDDLILVTVKAMHRRIPQGRRPSGKTLYVHQLEASGL